MKTYFKEDPATGLLAVVAIDAHTFESAIGGCRIQSYPSTRAATEDAKQLAAAMTLKMRTHHLPFGGAKAVIIEPDDEYDRTALFQSFGQFIESLKGAYITATDIGTTPADMDIIATQTAHVACTSESTGPDPSPFTAQTVFHAMCAAVKKILDRDTLQNLHVAIQGVGAVGYELAKLLHENGASLTVCDAINSRATQCANEFNANLVLPDKIYSVNSDIFSPCALGGTVNENTLKQFNTKIICGGANCQLADDTLLEALHEKEICYVPDYIANAGGIIHIAGQDHKIHSVYDRVIQFFEIEQTQTV